MASTSPNDPLVRAKRATKRSESAAAERVAALVAARDAGHSYDEIAKAVGASRQAVRQLVERARK